MSQGSMKESKVRLQFAPAAASRRQESGFKVDSLTKITDEIGGQTQIAGSEQASQNVGKKVTPTFDTIRDPHKSMLQLMDSIFDLLHILVYEANQANEDSKSQFHLLRPTLEKQTNSSASWLKTAPDLPAFIGKIYSCEWSMILKGTSEIILCYVIPSDRVISFNTEPEIYKPYLSISYFRKGPNFNWQIGNEVVTTDILPGVSKKLFDKLIRSVKNQQWNESTFCLDPIGLNTATEEARIIEANPATQLDPEQILMEMMQAMQEKAPKTDEFKIAGRDTVPAPVVNTDSSEKVAPYCPVPSLTLEETLGNLLALLEQRLEHLVGEGAGALNKHDFKGAQKVLTLTEQLQEFKNKAIEILTALKS